MAPFKYPWKSVDGVVEVAAEFGAVRLALEQIVEVETQLLSEVADLVVALIDQLAAVFVDLAVGEKPAATPAAPTNASRGIVHLRGVPRLPQAVGAGEASEPGAHDDDRRRTRCSRRRRQARESGDPEADRSRSFEQPGSRRCPTFSLPRNVVTSTFDVRHEGRTSHRTSPFRLCPACDQPCPTVRPGSTRR